MKVQGKTLEFDKSLWVQYGGVDVEERGPTLAVSGKDEDSFLKVLNHFGRVLKLYTFEEGRWVDADTGLEPASLDENQAGRLSTLSAPGSGPPTGAEPERAGDPTPRAGTETPPPESRKKAGASARNAAPNTGGGTRRAKTGRSAKPGGRTKPADAAKRGTPS